MDHPFSDGKSMGCYLKSSPFDFDFILTRDASPLFVVGGSAKGQADLLHSRDGYFFFNTGSPVLLSVTT